MDRSVACFFFQLKNNPYNKAVKFSIHLSEGNIHVPRKIQVNK